MTILMVVGLGSWRYSGSAIPFRMACCTLLDLTSGLYCGLAGLIKHHFASWFSLPVPNGLQYVHTRPVYPP